MINFLKNLLLEFWSLWTSLAPYLLLGLLVAGIIHLVLGKEFIIRHMGKGNTVQILKSVLLGVPLPICSCGVIPIADTLRKEGAHKSSVLAFLVATPTSGIDSILATYSLLGLPFALFRVAASFVAGFVVGLTDFWFEKDDLGQGEHREIAVPKYNSVSQAISEVWRYSTQVLPGDIAKWLLLGTFLGALLTVLVPQGFVAKYASFPFDFILALLIGVPLYVCATGSIPIAMALILKGFSPGAALVFLVVGPATNTVTLSFVKMRLGTKSFYLYLLSICLTAVLSGLLLNALWINLDISESIMHGGSKMLDPTILNLAGVILMLLLVTSSIRKRNKKKLDS